MGLCSQCGQISVGQSGEYQCPTCGLPTVWDDLSLREQLAVFEHEQWSGWMRWLFERGKWNDNGTFTIDGEWADRWHRQMTLHYSFLSETERHSDRKEVDKLCWLLDRLGVSLPVEEE